MAGALILGLVTLAFAGVYLGVRLGRPGVETQRRDMPRRLLSLSQGRTHAQWHGPEGGPVLVCVHGLSTPSFVWGPVLPRLTERGFRVLIYDLYGRGYSDRAPGRQDTGFFLRQLEDLLEAEGVTGRFALVGYSMGGAICTAFTARHPNRVERLILLAPAGLGHELGRFSRFVTRTPLIGDWVMEVLGVPILRSSYGEESKEDAIAMRALKELSVAGTLRAILSSMRGILHVDQSDLHRRIAQSGPSVTAIWGERDAVIPVSCRDRLAALNPDARQITLPDADHALTYTHPDDVAQAIV